MVFGGIEPSIPHNVLHQLLVVLCNPNQKTWLACELSLVPKSLVRVPESTLPNTWGV